MQMSSGFIKSGFLTLKIDEISASKRVRRTGH
jgi:hypothetical protein